MSETGTAESITTSNEVAKTELINRLKRLWQSEPANYWKEFRASGLKAKDVWPDQVSDNGSKEMLKPETMTLPSKRKGAKKEAE